MKLLRNISFSFYSCISFDNIHDYSPGHGLFLLTVYLYVLAFSRCLLCEPNGVLGLFEYDVVASSTFEVLTYPKEG
jgi:hypothetical protein